MKLVGVLLFTFFVSTLTIAQSIKDELEVVQLSGVVVAEEDEEVIVLPYVNVAIKGTNRGTTTEIDGFFSIVVVKGETIVYSRIGYKNEEYTIPDTLTLGSQSIVQSLAKDTVLLAEAVIYPWPNRESFKEEFLAMDVSDEYQLKADDNLKLITMESLRNQLRQDSREATSIMIQDNAKNLHSVGQAQILNIFNLGALKKFFDKWKSGGFKKKDTDKNAFDTFIKDKKTHDIYIKTNSTQKSKNEDH